MISSEREFGEIRTELKNLKENFEKSDRETKQHRASVDEKLDQIQETIQLINRRFDKMDGAWKATVIIGGIAGTAGAIVWKVAVWLLSIPVN